MKTEEFFEAVRKGHFTKLDIHNHIQEITHDYQQEKINILCNDFDNYIFNKYEKWRSSFSVEDIDEAVKRWNERGVKLPSKSDDKFKTKWLFIRDFFWRTRWGKPISDEEHKESMKELFGEDYKEDSKILDVNVLLGGFYYSSANFNMDTKEFPLLTLRDILIDLKRKHTSAIYKFDDGSEASNTIKGSQIQDISTETNSGVNFSVFNRVVYLTDLWHHADETVIDKLLNRETTDFLELNDRFNKELKRNIILTQSESSLKRLLKHYLIEINELYRSENKIDNLTSYANAPNSNKEKYRSYIFKKAGDDEFREADKFQNYILAKDEFLSIIFESLRNNIHRTGISISYFEKELKNSFLFLDGELIREFNIAKEIEGVIKADETINQKDYINWLKKEDDSLKQFIEALQEYDLIDTRETKAIIKDHFKPVREQNSKAKPIKWLGNQNLLVYLFRNLYQKYFINPAGKKWQIVSEHFIKKNGAQFKSGILASEANKQKEGVLPANGTHTIDKIIDRLIAD